MFKSMCLNMYVIRIRLNELLSERACFQRHLKLFRLKRFTMHIAVLL